MQPNLHAQSQALVASQCQFIPWVKEEEGTIPFILLEEEEEEEEEEDHSIHSLGGGRGG